MKRLLHIIATPRGEESNTLQVSNSFLTTFKSSHTDWIIDELDLSKEELPSLSMKSVSGKYVLLKGEDLHGSLKETWVEIIQHIERFKTADLFLISTPMWNFNIPYMLKHYLDLIIQPRYLFRYKKDGTVEGLIKDKKMTVISSRGGDYEGEMKSIDFLEPYLKHLFQFIGLESVEFINAQPTGMGKDRWIEALKQAQEKAVKAAKDA